MRIIQIDNKTHISPLSQIPGPLIVQVKSRLTFPNPQRQENERRGFCNWDTPESIQGYEIDGDQMIVPRGFSRQLLLIFRRAGVPYRIDNRRREKRQPGYLTTMT
jgi:hypothetical protein